MSNPLIVLDPSEVKKAAQEILSEPELFDSELGYFELGESYTLRRSKRAFSLIWSRIVWPIIALIASTCTGVYGGLTWENALRGFLAGVATLVVGLIIIFFFNYIFAAPKKIDDMLRGNLTAAKKQILEEKRKAERAVAVVMGNYKKCFDELTELKERKLIFELELGAFRSRVLLSDNDDSSMYRLNANLNIRFHNGDVNPRGVRRISLTVIDVSGREWALPDAWEPTIQHPADPNPSKFTGLRVDDADTTVYYLFAFYVDVPRECAETLNEHSFLRVKMEATRQDLFTRDFDVNWRAANNKETWITVRRSLDLPQSKTLA
jgi:hypothetical protein